MLDLFVRMAIPVIVVCGLAAALEPASGLYPVGMAIAVLWVMYRVLEGLGE